MAKPDSENTGKPYEASQNASSRTTHSLIIQSVAKGSQVTFFGFGTVRTITSESNNADVVNLAYL